MGTGAKKTIMGIDPGSNVTGYGVIEVSGNSAKCVALGVIDIHRLEDPYQKLKYIFDRVCELIDEYGPDEAALESPFFGNNVQSMLKLGRAQGVAMAAALSKGVPVSEYAPRRVKQAITGQGAASKEQVAALLKNILHLEELPKRHDATDGLAVAMCHFFQCTSVSGLNDAPKKRGLGAGNSGGKSWKEFVSANPGRVKKG